jgi:hypothetical protein
MQLKAVLVYHNVSRPEREASKLFYIDRVEPVVVGEVLHLDEGPASAFTVCFVDTTMEPTTITSWMAGTFDENARVNEAVAAGWTLER